MITVYDVAWHGADIVVVEDATCAELHGRLAARPDDHAVLVHDPIAGVVALLDRARLHELTEDYGFPLDARVRHVGLWDLLRVDQTAVFAGEPAARTAHVAAEHGWGVVIAMSDDWRPVGVFVPDNVPDRIGDVGMLSDDARHEVRGLAEGGARPWRLLSSVEVSLAGSGFHSENFNHRNPDLYECAGPIRHYLGRRPCERHPNAAIRLLASR